MKRSFASLGLLAVIVWVGCGLQLYLLHVNRVNQEKIKESLRQLNDANREVKEATERLQQLLKMLPPKAAPDHRSKL